MHGTPTATRRLVFSVACGVLILSCLLLLTGPAKAENAGFGLVVVEQVEFFQPLQHNIANLRGSLLSSGTIFTGCQQELLANFLEGIAASLLVRKLSVQFLV